MKFPSLFRVARPNQFNFPARYYDPVKEDIEQRTSRIKTEMKNDKSLDLRTNMRENFARRKRADRNASVLQIAIFAILSGGIVGWWFYGDKVFYLILLALPVYIYLRFKGRK